MSYRIKSVAKLTGISPTTLRAWERRYDVVVPQRTRSGYRVYSDDDIRTLTQVKALVDRGFKAGEAISLVRRGTAEAPLSLEAVDVAEVREGLLNAMLCMDRPECLKHSSRLVALPFDRQLDEVLLPLLREVGTRWAHGEALVAQEHFISMFVRERMVLMLESFASANGSSPEVVVAGLPGERHEFGLMAAAIHLAVRGWRVTYVGADLPVADLTASLRQRPPALLCTSLVLTRTPAEFRALAEELRAETPAETRVVIGGAGVPPDAASSPRTGLYLVRELPDLLQLEFVRVP